LENKILSENTRNIDFFKLRQRALHVFQGWYFKYRNPIRLIKITYSFVFWHTEANRVWKFRDICNSGSTTALQDLGQLMFDSHHSCRDLYECSHPQLDQLVEISRNHCLGARLTGAG
jgi:N-acetylgalactosamine kinase